jgi:hypothetical protein
MPRLTQFFCRVIDWDSVSLVPAPAAVHHPLFIVGIPGYRIAAPGGTDFAEDRLYLESAIRKQCPDAGGIADLLASSFERQFFEMALRNKRISQEYARLRLGPTKCGKEALSKQLDEFLLRNKKMETHLALKTLRERLCKLDA